MLKINLVNKTVDLTKLRAPGASIRDAIIPTEQIVAAFQTGDWGVEAYYQFGHDPVKLDPKGAFYGSDVASTGAKSLLASGGWKEGTYGADQACSYAYNVLQLAAGNAANSLTYSTLWNLMADYPEFREKKSGSHIWADPTFFSFFIGAILCQISDIKIEEMIEKIEVYEKMEKFITGLETLGKTDANGQWRYYANTIIDFCEIFGLDKNNFVDNRDLCQGNNLLSYLSNYLNK